MSGDVHVQFCERPGVRFPRATHLALFADNPARLEAHLARLQYDTGLTGVAAAVMTDGRLVATAASDERRRGSGIPVTVDDRWHVGSVTKSMTATLLAVLEDDGLLSADDTVAALLPEFEVSDGWAACTLDHLLTHTAGAPANFPRSVQSVWPETPGELVAARRRFIAPVLAREPESPCGERFAYSNVGYRWPATPTNRCCASACSHRSASPAPVSVRRKAMPRTRSRGARRQLAGDGSRGRGAHDNPRPGALRRGPPGRRIRPLASPAAARGVGAAAHAGSRRLCARLGPLRTRLGGRSRALAQRQQYVWYALLMLLPAKNTVLAFATNEGSMRAAETAFVELAGELGRSAPGILIRQTPARPTGSWSPATFSCGRATGVRTRGRAAQRDLPGMGWFASRG